MNHKDIVDKARLTVSSVALLTRSSNVRTSALVAQSVRSVVGPTRVLDHPTGCSVPIFDAQTKFGASRKRTQALKRRRPANQRHELSAKLTARDEAPPKQ